MYFKRFLCSTVPAKPPFGCRSFFKRRGSSQPIFDITRHVIRRFSRGCNALSTRAIACKLLDTYEMWLKDLGRRDAGAAAPPRKSERRSARGRGHAQCHQSSTYTVFNQRQHSVITSWNGTFTTSLGGASVTIPSAPMLL